MAKKTATPDPEPEPQASPLPVDLVWIGDGLRHVPGFPMADLVAQPADAPGLISTGLYAPRTAEQPQDAPADSAPNTPAPNDPSETPPAE